MSQRLCEVSEELRAPVMRLGEGGDVATVRRWAGLRCPRRDHCDESSKCKGFTPANRQRISEIEDELFVRGFTKTGGSNGK